jgi:hypothetical protein
MDDFAAVDDFLAASHRIGLEEVLCDGCLTGWVRLFLTDVASIAPTMVQSERDDDGGLSATYEGTLTVEGVAYPLPLPRLHRPRRWPLSLRRERVPRR